MTNTEFKSEITNLYRKSNRFNRFWAIILIIIGITFLVNILFTGIDIKTNDQLVRLVSTIGILVLPFIPITGGLLVIYKIPRQFNETQILSSIIRDNKLKVIESSLAEYKILGKESYNDMIIYYCRNRYFSYFKIYFYIDNSQILFTIQAIDFSHQNYPGVFDLGLSKRVTKKITKKINASL
jgi:hypothetical protein